MTYHLIFIAFTLLVSCASNGQELNVPVPKYIDKQWWATWITNPDISGNEYAVVLLRKGFQLSVVPDQFIISTMQLRAGKI